MGIFVLFLSVFLFSNIVNSDIETESVHVELSRYQFEDTITIQNGEVQDSYTFKGIDGGGITARTVYSELPNWENTLNFRVYYGVDYLLTIYTTGVEYVRKRQNSAVRLSVGGELGLANLEIGPLNDYGSIDTSIGWEIHTTFKNHFVYYDNLWSYFIRPSLRSYQFQFKGNNGIDNETIDAEGFVLAFGLGYHF